MVVVTTLHSKPGLAGEEAGGQSVMESHVDPVGDWGSMNYIYTTDLKKKTALKSQSFHTMNPFSLLKSTKQYYQL